MLTGPSLVVRLARLMRNRSTDQTIPLTSPPLGNVRRWACQIVQFATSCLEPALKTTQSKHTTAYLVHRITTPIAVAYRLLCMFRDIILPPSPNLFYLSIILIRCFSAVTSHLACDS